MSVDESEEDEKLPEAFTERLTNSFNLAIDLRDSYLNTKVGFDDEDQVRFTASPQTTQDSKQNSMIADVPESGQLAEQKPSHLF